MSNRIALAATSLTAAALAACAPPKGAGPDLIVTRVAPSISSGAPNDPFVLQSSYRNVGAATVPAGPGDLVSTSMDLFLTHPDGRRVEMIGSPEFGGYLIGHGARNDLRAGDEENFRADVRVPTDIPPGDYRLCGEVDVANNVAETNERNNRRCAPFTIVAPLLPDLAMTRLDASRTSGRAGEALTVRSAFENRGPGDVPAPADPSVDVAVSVDIALTNLDGTPVTEIGGAEWGGHIYWWGPVGAVPAGAREDETANATVPGDVAPGRYQICAVVDFGDRIAEVDETNNRQCVPFTLLGASGGD